MISNLSISAGDILFSVQEDSIGLPLIKIGAGLLASLFLKKVRIKFACSRIHLRIKSEKFRDNCPIRFLN